MYIFTTCIMRNENERRGDAARFLRNQGRVLRFVNCYGRCNLALYFLTLWLYARNTMYTAVRKERYRMTHAVFRQASD